jgi:hypothetical protein
LIIPEICSGKYLPIPPIGEGGVYSPELIDIINKMLTKVFFKKKNYDI